MVGLALSTERSHPVVRTRIAHVSHQPCTPHISSTVALPALLNGENSLGLVVDDLGHSLLKAHHGGPTSWIYEPQIRNNINWVKVQLIVGEIHPAKFKDEVCEVIREGHLVSISLSWTRNRRRVLVINGVSILGNKPSPIGAAQFNSVSRNALALNFLD